MQVGESMSKKEVNALYEKNSKIVRKYLEEHKLGMSYVDIAWDLYNQIHMCSNEVSIFLRSLSFVDYKDGKFLLKEG